MAVRVSGRITLGFTQPTPSASLRPGDNYDYAVGVEPYINNAGLVLTTVTSSTVIPGCTVSVITGTSVKITVNTAGTTLTGYYVPDGWIDVKAANCTIDRCKVEGFNETTLTANKGLINATSQSATGLTVKDTTLLLNTSHNAAPWNGIMGHDFTATRVKVRHVTDCFGVYNANSGHTTDPVNILIDGCDGDLMTYTSPDPNHSGDSPISHSHNDWIQIQGAAAGSSIEIRYSNIMGELDPSLGQVTYSSTNPDPVTGGYNTHYPYTEANSAIILTPNVTAIYGLNVHDNWLDGGAYTINVASTVTNNFGSITNNKFGHDTRPDVTPAYQISYPAASGATVSGNVYTDTGLPVAVHAY